MEEPVIRRNGRRSRRGGRTVRVGARRGLGMLAVSLAVAAGLPADAALAEPGAGGAPRTVAGGSARPVRALTDGDVTVVGAGFGHGVGMTQYGAYGMARAGNGVGTILRHYYSGTTVTGVRDDVDLRVNVVDRGSRVTLGTRSLASGGGAFRLVPDGGSPVSLASGDSVVLSATDGGVRADVTRDGATKTLSATVLGVRWSGGRGMAGPASALTVDAELANASSSTTKSRQYRWGSFEVRSVARSESDGATRRRLAGVVTVDLHDEYLRGLGEVPFSWPAAALQSQVVAARNFALGRYRAGTSTVCGGCHVWDDSRSQVYSGYAKESGPNGGRWVSAVEATQTSGSAGLAVLFGGSPITAYYSSSSGGRTRDVAEVWGSDIPYLRSVSDPWSADRSINPSYASWTRTVKVTKVLSVFGLPDLASLTVSARDDAGAARTVTATASDGTSKTLPGSILRSAFGLPAQWVSDLTLPT